MPRRLCTTHSPAADRGSTRSVRQRGPPGAAGEAGAGGAAGGGPDAAGPPRRHPGLRLRGQVSSPGGQSCPRSLQCLRNVSTERTMHDGFYNGVILLLSRWATTASPQPTAEDRNDVMA